MTGMGFNRARQAELPAPVWGRRQEAREVR